MDFSCSGIYIPQIRCKADLMKYCLESNPKRNKRGEIVGRDLQKAQKMFDFFISNVELPDVEAPAGAELYGMIKSVLADRLGPVAPTSA